MGELVTLTRRQVEIVILIGRDQLTYHQVATRLRIRPETARAHA
jgi:DNA-binding CsgD family transcriptional regulator